jgi:hypothetical protein
VCRAAAPAISTSTPLRSYSTAVWADDCAASTRRLLLAAKRVSGSSTVCVPKLGPAVHPPYTMSLGAPNMVMPVSPPNRTPHAACARVPAPQSCARTPPTPPCAPSCVNEPRIPAAVRRHSRQRTVRQPNPREGCFRATLEQKHGGGNKRRAHL